MPISYIKKELVGSFIGEGLSRKVYNYGENNNDINWIIKVAKNDDAVWHNKTEFMVWSYAVLNNDYSVFAPVIALSDCWKYLVMVKVERVGEFRVKQRFMPSYMKGADLHFSNIGLLGGKPVFCDYGDPVILDRFPIPV